MKCNHFCGFNKIWSIYSLESNLYIFLSNFGELETKYVSSKQGPVGDLVAGNYGIDRTLRINLGRGGFN